jgi:hypothetical protein
MLQELANKVTSFLMIVSRDLESQFPWNHMVAPLVPDQAMLQGNFKILNDSLTRSWEQIPMKSHDGAVGLWSGHNTRACQHGNFNDSF